MRFGKDLLRGERIVHEVLGCEVAESGRIGNSGDGTAASISR